METTEKRGYPLIDPAAVAQVDAINPAISQIDADVQTVYDAVADVQSAVDGMQATTNEAVIGVQSSIVTLQAAIENFDNISKQDKIIGQYTGRLLKLGTFMPWWVNSYNDLDEAKKPLYSRHPNYPNAQNPGAYLSAKKRIGISWSQVDGGCPSRVDLFTNMGVWGGEFKNISIPGWTKQAKTDTRCYKPLPMRGTLEVELDIDNEWEGMVAMRMHIFDYDTYEFYDIKWVGDWNAVENYWEELGLGIYVDKPCNFIVETLN